MRTRTVWRGMSMGLIGVLSLAMDASAAESLKAAEPPRSVAPDLGSYVKSSETFPKVLRFCDQVIAHGRDKYGEKHLHIFVNAFDLTTKTAPPGPDRVGSLNGHRPGLCNLQLQASLLRLLWHMTDMTGDPKYRQAVEACLRDYFQFVVHPETGDFPWGTHSGYDATLDSSARSEKGKKASYFPTEEKITDFPWDILYTVNPQGTLRVADRFRLCFDKEMTTWFHHRDIGPLDGYLQPLPKFNTSGRQGNHPYLISAVVHAEAWALAWSKTQDPKYLEWLERLLKTVEGSLVAPDAVISGIVNVHRHPAVAREGGWEGRSMGTEFGSPYLWSHAMLRVNWRLGEKHGKPFLDSGLRQLDRWAQQAYDAKGNFYRANFPIYADANGKRGGAVSESLAGKGDESMHDERGVSGMTRRAFLAAGAVGLAAAMGSRPAWADPPLNGKQPNII
jgi:hypothetical protein